MNGLDAIANKWSGKVVEVTLLEDGNPIVDQLKIAVPRGYWKLKAVASNPVRRLPRENRRRSGLILCELNRHVELAAIKKNRKL